MAQKSPYTAEERGAEIEEALDALDKLIDRLKVLYEQYFMGIQKQAPSHLHTDAERRIRDVAQMQIRNTALRYRFATIQQKYGSYNTYWKRSLREIEAGRYVRNLSKLRRQAQLSGDSIPPEIMAAMPKRMRDAVERDRIQALADAQRRGQLPAPEAAPAATGAVDDGDTEQNQPRFPAPAAPRSRGQVRITTDPFANANDEDVASALAGLFDDALSAIARPPPQATRPPPIAGATRPPPMAGATRPPPIAGATRPPPMSGATRPPPIAGATRPPPMSGATQPPPMAGATRPPPMATQPPPVAAPARPPVPGMTEGETRALYAKYVKAREVVGDKTEGLTYERLVRSLSSQAPKILEQHKAKAIEFNVVIRDNKVVLKAKPK